MIFETLIADVIEQLGGDNSLIYLEKDYELIVELQDGLITKITHEEIGDSDFIEINAELGAIPDDAQCLIALLMANKYQQEDNKAVFSINAESEKVTCTIKLNVEDSETTTILDQLKRLISYQNWFSSFQDESNDHLANNSYHQFTLRNKNYQST